MIYVIGTVKTNEEITEYKVIETLTESFMSITPYDLKNLIVNSAIKVRNAELQNNEIKLRDWVSNMAQDTNDIKKCRFMITSIKNDIYTIVSYRGAVRKLSYNKLSPFVNNNDVANCTITLNKLSHEDVDTLVTNKKFESDIADKYKIFEAKVALLGLGDMSFEYRIEDQEVILEKYTSTSKNIILPSFITVIMQDAFANIRIRTIELNEGLRIIGNEALSPNNPSKGLNEIEIPSTVQLIGTGAVYNNSKLFNSEGALHPHRFRLRNDKTIVLNQNN